MQKAAEAGMPDPHRERLELRVAIGASLRRALAKLRLDPDPATVEVLRECDEAARELAAYRRAPCIAKTAAADRCDDDPREVLRARLERLAQSFREGPGAAPLADIRAEPEATFAADLLQKQQNGEPE
ncbi:MAG TPA: hypothetical protein VGF07_10120 [Stellaceae bacterium]|jgi:hypothetical protein